MRQKRSLLKWGGGSYGVKGLSVIANFCSSGAGGHFHRRSGRPADRIESPGPQPVLRRRRFIGIRRNSAKQSLRYLQLREAAGHPPAMNLFGEFEFISGVKPRSKSGKAEAWNHFVGVIESLLKHVEQK